MLNLTSLIVSRSTRIVASCADVVRAIADKRLKKCRRKPRGRGFAVETKKLLLIPDYINGGGFGNGGGALCLLKMTSSSP